jgi:probable addiction module antidote protein
MPKLKTTRFDAAEYLKSEKECVTFLEAAFESADTAHIAKALGVVARARGMMKLAKETGLTREALYRMLSEDGNPTLDTLLKIAKAFGLHLTVSPA